MQVKDSTAGNRSLSLNEPLDSSVVAAFLRSEGYATADAEEMAAQLFDTLEAAAHAQRYAAVTG